LAGAGFDGKRAQRFLYKEFGIGEGECRLELIRSPVTWPAIRLPRGLRRVAPWDVTDWYEEDPRTDN